MQGTSKSSIAPGALLAVPDPLPIELSCESFDPEMSLALSDHESRDHSMQVSIIGDAAVAAFRLRRIAIFNLDRHCLSPSHQHSK